PLGEPRAPLPVLGEALPEPVETLGDRLVGEQRQWLGPRVHLDPGDRPRGLEDLDERYPVVGRLPDRLVEQDHAADVLAQTRRREEHLAVVSPRLLRGPDPDLVEPLLDRAGGLVRGEDALAGTDELERRRPHRVAHPVTSASGSERSRVWTRA